MGKKVFSNSENAGAVFPVSTPVATGSKDQVTARIGLDKNIVDQSTSKTDRMGLGKMKGGRISTPNGDRPSSFEMFTPAPTVAPAETVSRAGKDRHTDPFSTDRDTVTPRAGKKVFEPVQKEEAVQKRKTYSRVSVDATSTAAPGPKIRPTGRSTQGNSSNVSTINLVEMQSGVKSAEGGSVVTANPSRKPAGSITELGEGAALRRSSLRTATVVTNHPQKWLNDKPMTQYNTSLNGVWTPMEDHVSRKTPAPAPFASTTENSSSARIAAPEKKTGLAGTPRVSTTKGLLNPKPYTPAEAASSAKLQARAVAKSAPPPVKTLSIMNRPG